MSIRAGRAEPGRRALVGGMIVLTNQFHRTVNACLSRGSVRNWPGFRASGDRREVHGPSADRTRGSGTGIDRGGQGATPLLLLAVSLLAPPTLATGTPAGDDQPPAAARTDAISAADPRWLDRLPPLTLPLPRPDASADIVGMKTDPVAEAAAPKTALPAPDPAPASSAPIEPEPTPAAAASEPAPASLAPDPTPASPAPSEPEPAPAAAAPTPEPAPVAPDPTPASPDPSEPQVAATPETREPPAAIDPSAAADLDEALESEAASSIEVLDSLVFAGSAPDVATSADSGTAADPNRLQNGLRPSAVGAVSAATTTDVSRTGRGLDATAAPDTPADPDAGDPKPPIPSPTAAARHTSSASSPSATASDLPPPAGTDLSNPPAPPPVAPLASRYRWHVQILAGRSLELVKKDRDRFALRHAQLLEGLTLTISRPRNAKRGSFYRLRATEWTSRQAATDWCARLSARGRNCLVIRVTP